MTWSWGLRSLFELSNRCSYKMTSHWWQGRHNSLCYKKVIWKHNKYIVCPKKYIFFVYSNRQNNNNHYNHHVEGPLQNYAVIMDHEKVLFLLMHFHAQSVFPLLLILKLRYSKFATFSISSLWFLVNMFCFVILLNLWKSRNC